MKKKGIAITISIIVLILLFASISFYLIRFRADHVDLAYIKVEISSNVTNEEYDDWFRDMGWGDDENYLSLPHCSDADYDGRVINVHGSYDRSTDVIVIIDYGGIASFSGGGDDIFFKTLRKGQTLTVHASHNTTIPLYDINTEPGSRISPITSGVGGEKQIIFSYPMIKSNPLNASWVREFEIIEVHNYEIKEDVTVRLSFPGPCE